MISEGISGLGDPRTAAEAALHHLESWWGHKVLEHHERWTGDARFHLGQARRAFDHGDVARAEREATRALELDHRSPWPLVVLGRCALARGRAWDAIQAFSRAQNRSPHNRYVTALLAKAERVDSGSGQGMVFRRPCSPPIHLVRL